MPPQSNPVEILYKSHKVGTQNLDILERLAAFRVYFLL